MKTKHLFALIGVTLFYFGVTVLTSPVLSAA